MPYPGSTTTGEVQLFDAFNLQDKLMIPSHDSPLDAIAFNPSVSASYLPAQVSDTLNQSRTFATVTVPLSGVPNIVTIATLSRQLRLLLASSDGYFYIFNIPEVGGECVMVKQHRLHLECVCQDADATAEAAVTPPDSPSVIQVTQESHSPCQDESPPPTVQNPEM